MKKLNLYFGDYITKEQWPRVVSALRNYCPGIVWAGGDDLDKPVGGGVSTITVNYISYIGVDYVVHRASGILDSNSAPHMPKDFPQPIDGWKWVDEYTTDFDTTSGMFDTLYESEEEESNLSLYFDPPITSISDLDSILTVINDRYPNLVWLWTNRGITSFNPLKSSRDWPIYVLNITYYRSNKELSYSTGNVPKWESMGYIDGWVWVDFDTEKVFNSLYESSDNPNGLIEIGYNDLKEGMAVIVNGAAGRMHRWDNEIARVIYFDPQGGYENPLLLFNSWNDGHEGPITSKFVPTDDEWVDDVEGTQMFPACEEHKCWFMMPDYKVKYYVVDSFDPFDALNESEEEEETEPIIGSTLYCHQKFGGFKVGGYYTVTDLEPCYENNCIKLNNTDFRLTIYPDDSGRSYKTWFTLVDYDETSRLFDSLNESTGYKPKLVLKFDPPLNPLGVEYGIYINALKNTYPDLKWGSGRVLDNYRPTTNIYNFHVDRWQSLRWANRYNTVDVNGTDAKEWLSSVNGFNTEDMFNSLYESTDYMDYQPKLNLKFDPPIEDNNDWFRVKEVILLHYPDLLWRSGKQVDSDYIPFFGYTEDYVYYLTIGNESEKPDRLSYSEQDEKDEDYQYIDGWEWVKDNGIDYDETSKLFDSLNESKEGSDVKYFNLIFDPPLASGEWPLVTEIIKELFPGRIWCNDQPLEWFPDMNGDGKSNIITLSLSKDGISYGMKQTEIIRGIPSFNGRYWLDYKGIQIPNVEVDYDETSKLFDSLNN